MSLTQRTKDSTLMVSLPNINVSMSRIYPFKRKQRVGKEKWYEKISLQYSGSFSNSITCKEDYFLKSNFVNSHPSDVFVMRFSTSGIPPLTMYGPFSETTMTFSMGL